MSLGSSRGLRADSLEQALRWLAEDPALVPVAGCTDLMVAEPLQRAAMNRVLDITKIPELRAVRSEPSGLVLGAGLTFAEIARRREVIERFPALAAAARQVGGWQIQNRASLGGNLANASPAGDSPPVLLALGATVRAASADGERDIPYDQFHVGYRKTALARGELLREVWLPWPHAAASQAFRKVGTRAAQAISKVAVAICGYVDESGRVIEVRLGAGSVAATPVRLRGAEQAILGRTPDEAAEAAGLAAIAEVTPIDDVRSTAEYRRHVLHRVVRRLVAELGSTSGGLAR